MHLKHVIIMHDSLWGVYYVYQRMCTLSLLYVKIENVLV